MTPAALMSLLLVGALAHHQSQWSYSVGPLDQNHWPWEYPACGGERQSPINVQRNKVQYNPSLKALNLTGYDAKGRQFPMTNTGSTVQIGLPSTMRMTASDGTEYVAVQMHFHWGSSFPDISGSEHTIDGLRYAAEVHVVHYNSKYNSYEKAKSAPDGLAVLAALVEVKDYTENMYYDDFFYHLRTIKYKGQNIILKGLDVQGMLPKNLDSYYTYQGSLTTPPCTQNVQWFLLADMVPFSRAQIEALQDSLLDVENRVIHNNYRSIQPLNTNRVVEANFVHQPNPQCF